jgi:hypothetical protein
MYTPPVDTDDAIRVVFTDVAFVRVDVRSRLIATRIAARNLKEI